MDTKDKRLFIICKRNY